MTKELLEKAKELENEIAELELSITGYECILKKLQHGKAVMLIEGIVRFSFNIDNELGAYMIQHYQNKMSERKIRLELLKKQFNEL